MMNAAANRQNGQPDAAQIRAQVARMTASNVFCNSPQLASFLLFIVEAVLRGHAERLKGYTIGVEVLRRDVSFDPQIDPIVRVEATRLRRAIERYYAGPGADDAVLIALPRGGYVPRISWRAREPAVTPGADPPHPDALAPGNGLPTLRVAPFVVTGRPGARVIDGEALSGRLCEAFALFDMINVIGAAPAANGRYDYRVDGTLEYREDMICLRFRLVDKTDETVIWSRMFEAQTEDSDATERKVILELAASIAQRFGIIWSHDRTRQFADNVGDPRYRALIQAGEAFRAFDPAVYARTHAELERLIALDPGFAGGYSYLAVVHAVEYAHGYGGRPDDVAALDRALTAARRGIELKPHSAVAYHALFVVLFFRGEIEAASAAAEKAMSLNPYDLWIATDYGGRLIFAGQVDKGMEILRGMVGFGAILPSWTHFYLFLGHYLREEYADARFHAGQMTSDTHVYGRLARALMARFDGQPAEARATIAAITSEHPRWKADPGREIRKLIVATEVADRILRDLAEVGLAPPS